MLYVHVGIANKSFRLPKQDSWETAQVIKLREHERRWAESTADEMSLRAELCAMKDECASTSGNAAILRNRCETLERDNAELGER